ncbi:AraC family transcriptional regulator [Lacinutrix sp. Hel_I_90]|uniref:helix-turn-helix domain-containing protein n=1 Tax=Lacinutrix sp. Hel_I_90 TaxID=1249999 RepID=UPI000696337D|nr:AraC family transcriptional regulator [Lacinutrix sp. Hel_I_90]
MNDPSKTQCTLPPLQLIKFQEELGGKITEDYGLFKLTFNTNLGSGIIQYANFNYGISVLDIEVLLTNDFTFRLGDRDAHLLYFIYCAEGIAQFKSNNNDKYQKIEELKSGVLSCDHNSENKINIKKEVPFAINIISVDKALYFERFNNNTFSNTIKLQELFKSFDGFNSYVYQCAYNLKIAEQLRCTKDSGISNALTEVMRFESQHLLILALHIEELYKEIHQERTTTTLNKTELQKIIQLTEYIMESPEIQHSISSLCGRICMSPAKLQEGFKEMHDTTVADFIRNVRIEKAEELLNETDLNISEIVYTIGLTSRSYFCKIFKKKYDCSPKRYRKLIRNKALA